MINETTFETDAQKTRRHNDRLKREALENAKRRDEEIAARRREWEQTPEHLKVCEVCTFPLDEPTKAMIVANPMAQRNHTFCSPFNFEPGVVKGLVGLLKEVFGEEPIPLSALEQVVKAFQACGGHCSVSKIKLNFPVEETKDNTPREYSSVISKIDQEVMRHHADAEREQRKRQATLHSPVIVFDADGKLTLVSKTVQRWREGLSDDEFRELVHTLNEQLKSFRPGHILTQTSDYRYNSPPKVVGGIR